MGRKIMEIENAGIQVSITFASTVAVGSFFLGVYNLLGLEFTIPFFKPIAESLGLWWFAVAVGGAALYAFNKFASKLPSPFE